MDFGYMDVTFECPESGCSGTETVRVWGQNGESIYRTVECTTCSVTNAMKVVITVSGAVTEYELA
jgi:hypothetical protein